VNGDGEGDVAGVTREFFEQLARKGHDQRLGSARGTVRFDITDDRTGGVESWLVTLDRGAISVANRADRADCVVETDSQTFERLADGTLTGTTAMLRGAVSAEGAVDLLLYFQRLLPSPPPPAHDQLHAAQESA